MKLYFVRHAEPNYENHNDMLRELSNKGMKDRKLVTDFLTDKRVDIVLSSPYKRAYALKLRMSLKTIKAININPPAFQSDV